jgi:hypothetical protein
LVAILEGSVIFGWSRSFVIICIFSIYEFIGTVHEFWYCLWLSFAHLLDEIQTAKPEYKGINCSLVGDVLCWVFIYALALYIWP